MWENVAIFFIVLLAICGGVNTILTAWEKVSRLANPYKDLENKVDAQEKRIDANERRLDAHDKFFDNDSKQLRELARLSKRSFQVDLVLLNHFIDGNGVEQMKELREELQNDIIGADW